MEDKYIRLLKIVRKDFESNNKKSYDEFLEILNEVEIKSDSMALWTQIYNVGALGSTGPSVMGLDAYFKLLEYEELKEARESSKKASKQARNAIYIAIFTLIASLGFSIWQILSPIKIHQDQLNSIREQIHSLKQ